MFETDLNIGERIRLLTLLPRTGNVVTLRVVQELSKELGFTEDEITGGTIVQEEGRVTWPNQINRSYEFGDVAVEVMATPLKALEAAEKLTSEHLTIYEKFVESKKE